VFPLYKHKHYGPDHHLWDNNGTGLRTNGNQMGSLFVANADADGVAPWTVAGSVGAKNVSFTDPQDRVRLSG
jgi:hypothetical protein